MDEMGLFVLIVAYGASCFVLGLKKGFDKTPQEC
jgi:hypothetical protein